MGIDPADAWLQHPDIQVGLERAGLSLAGQVEQSQRDGQANRRLSISRGRRIIRAARRKHGRPSARTHDG